MCFRSICVVVLARKRGDLDGFVGFREWVMGLSVLVLVYDEFVSLGFWWLV